MEKRLIGEEIFFNFEAIPYQDLVNSPTDIVREVMDGKRDGFVATDVFNQEEVAQIKAALENLPQAELMDVVYGKIFPAPFAVINDSMESVENYFGKLKKFYAMQQTDPALKLLNDRVDSFFRKVAKTYKVSVPINNRKHEAVAGGTARFFFPNKGGLHVHCGYSHQEVKFYYQITNDMDFMNQLSYFLVLQNSEVGGELTIYDMLWENIKKKDDPENNEYVIDGNGNRLYLTDVRSFAVRPQPGDILVFAGGPIWHRVENIKGTLPRITYGGFINFSKDKQEAFYWS